MRCEWKTNDEFPGSISLPFGIKTSHTWHEVGQILRIINDLGIVSFLEIGVHVGGLASIISCVSKYREFYYSGAEINPDLVDDRIKEYVLFGNVLNEDFARMCIPPIGKKMIYCDGGDKISEMKLYKKFLSPGDVIACHDYYDGQGIIGLPEFGESEKCGCRPEVFKKDLAFDDWTPLPLEFVIGTRIIGFVR